LRGLLKVRRSEVQRFIQPRFVKSPALGKVARAAALAAHLAKRLAE